MLHKLVPALLRCEKIFTHAPSLESSKNKRIKRKREHGSVSCNKQLPLRSPGEKELLKGLSLIVLFLRWLADE